MNAGFIGLLWRWLFVIVLGVVAPTLRAATDQDPAAMLPGAIEEVLAIAYPESGAIAPDAFISRARPVLERTMDFETITRRALGPGWRQLTVAERVRAVELFTALVLRVYAGRFTSGERPDIRYLPMRVVAPERWEVPTQVRRDGVSYEIVFRIERRPDGLRISDIVAEGVSFVANYRGQFDALFQKGGAAAVLRALEAKVPANAGD